MSTEEDVLAWLTSHGPNTAETIAQKLGISFFVHFADVREVKVALHSLKDKRAVTSFKEGEEKIWRLIPVNY